MELLNALSIPRSYELFARKRVPGSCLITDVIGNCVYVSAPSVSGVVPVRTADPADQSKMPALGVIIAKSDDTSCTVQWLGEANGFLGLTSGTPIFVGDSGAIADAPPIPGVGEFRYIQHMGMSFGDERILIVPNFLMSKRIG